jgi:hypothetical protein
MVLATLLKLSNLLRGIRKDEKPQQEPWFGSYLDEDGVVSDVLKRITADPIAVKNWLDPWSWRFPPIGDRQMPFAPKLDVPENAGCLLFAPMSIRNYYGMWHANNPHTEAEDAELTDGFITDPRHPDNFSGRVIDRVKAELAARFPQQEAA